MQSDSISHNESLRLALDLAYGLLERLLGTNFVPYETMIATEAVAQMSATPVRQVLRSLHTAVKLFHFLQHEEVPRDEHSIATPSAVSASEGVPQPKHDTFLEQLDAMAETDQIEGLCRFIVDELTQMQSRLREAEATRSKWAMIAEGEEARLKTIKSLQVGIKLAERLLGPSATKYALPPGKTELEVALALRKKLIPAAREMSAAAQLGSKRDPTTVLSAMNRVRVAIADLFGIAVYQYIRTQDRHHLQTVRQHVDGWFDGDHNQTAGMVVLERVADLAKNFFGINQRRILMAHDRLMRDEALICVRQLIAHPADPVTLDRLESMIADLSYRDAQLSTRKLPQLEAMLVGMQI